MHHIITPESIVYQRPVQYYETDRMQIVHHSNYIRWKKSVWHSWHKRAFPMTRWNTMAF